MQNKSLHLDVNEQIESAHTLASRFYIDPSILEIEKETEVAKGGLQQEAERLAGEIIRAVLAQGAAPSAAGGAR